MTLETPLKRLTGVGDRVAEKLELLGLFTVGDLLYYFPYRYEDYSAPTPIANLLPGEPQIIRARIQSIDNELSPRRHMKLTKALAADNSGQIALTWFNQPFLTTTLKPGTTWLFAGKVEQDYRGNRTMVSPAIEREEKILPIYHETAGLTSKLLRKLYGQIKPVIESLPDYLPDTIKQPQHLSGLADALVAIHFPSKIEQVDRARERLAFDELFLLMLRIHKTKKELAVTPAVACPIDVELLQRFSQSLPFALTPSQKQASWQIIQDLAKSLPMNRLLEGDVGSGKTVVGAMAALSVIKAGHRVVWMAPTEILARQHHETCERLLTEFDVKSLLLTGSTSKKAGGLANDYDLIIGTQAVIQDKVQFTNLGLIIIDEQHRFGVKQRSRLLMGDDQVPHFLAMTATPIPRTLALTIYGDLDISAIQSVPTNRKPIISKFVGPQQRQEAYTFIRNQIKLGRQAFVVCPLVDPSKTMADGQLPLELEEKRAATAEYEKLKRQIFPDLRVGLLHGKMKPAEKSTIMQAFKERQIDILVATAVIEVGIDIPNATVMMIEGAERFGLAQLHQFRGRVGRGEHQSYCFVFTDSLNPAAHQRLRAFTETTSGFDLAELDLELRGPGQLAGLQQSGLGDLKLASLSDISLIQQAKNAVTEVIENGLECYPTLITKLEENQQLPHLA